MSSTPNDSADRLELGAMLCLFVEAGFSIAEIARECGLSEATVYRRLREARHAGKWSIPKAIPKSERIICRWPVGPLTPLSECRCHIDPIPPGSLEYCPVCHRSGFDTHPSLQLKPEERARLRKAVKPRYVPGPYVGGTGGAMGARPKFPGDPRKRPPGFMFLHRPSRVYKTPA